MKISYVVVLLVGAFAYSHGEEKGEEVLMSNGMTYLRECTGDIEISFPTCLEMMKEGTDASPDKYKSCKCLISCVAQKFETLKKEGGWDWEMYEKHKSTVENQDYVKEGNKIRDECKDKPSAQHDGDNCESSYKMFDCVMTVSAMAKKIVTDIVKSMTGGDDEE